VRPCLPCPILKERPQIYCKVCERGRQLPLSGWMLSSSGEVVLCILMSRETEDCRIEYPTNTTTHAQKSEELTQVNPEQSLQIIALCGTGLR
jgi:hypothetical protein